MNRIGIIFQCVDWRDHVLRAKRPSVAAQTTPAAIGHGAFPVKVVKTLDSSKLKEGDNVEVETAGAFKLPDGTLVPKGSKLTGHVTSSKARSKGDSDSQLTVSFDKLNITNGKQLSVKGIVQAVFPPPDEPMGPNMSTSRYICRRERRGPGSRCREPIRGRWRYRCEIWLRYSIDVKATRRNGYEGHWRAGDG